MMPQGEKNHRRLDALMWVGAVIWLVLVGRLVQVQGLQYSEYASRAKEQHQRTIDLQANRGAIYDRAGRELAVDVNSVSFYADPKLLREPERVARHFAPHSSYDGDHLENQLRSGRRFVYLARQLDDSAASQIRKKVFSGVFENRETRRCYPYGPLGAQLVGYTDIDNMGSEGVERSFNGELSEENGLALCFVDAFGQQVPGLLREHSLPLEGRSVILTIDAEFQNILEDELVRSVELTGAESAIGIITEPHTGAVLAMANVPRYDPNHAGGVGATKRRNRVVTDSFEPGSTFKIIATAAVLEDGLGQPDEQIFCERGELELENGDIIRDHVPYDMLTFAQVIERSSNIGTIKIARRLQRKRFYEFIRNFGFGTRSGIELPAESPGILQHVGKWSERSLETIAIGQEIGVTALQLALAFGAVANGGNLMAPQIFSSILDADGNVVERVQPRRIRKVISKRTAARVKAMLSAVVSRGTGRRAAIDGIQVAGKTGTAQQAAADGAGYDPDRTVASFIGFAPAENPQFLCLIAVTNPREDSWGGAIAAPVFKRVIERIIYQSDDHDMAVHFEAVPAVVATAPDLRGMRRSVAQYQAGLRAMPVIFSGKGELIIGQEPAAGESIPAGKTILCRLGSPGAEVVLSEATPSRQSALLQSLTSRSAVKKL
jgi:cell division protein FtsI (penicillin-binding protein 3)